RDRHQLDRGDPELAELLQPWNDVVERPAGREGADVQLVEHELLELQVRAGSYVERARVDDPGRSAQPLRLEARAGIGLDAAAVEDVEVVVAGAGAHRRFPEAFVRPGQ